MIVNRCGPNLLFIGILSIFVVGRSVGRGEEAPLKEPDIAIGVEVSEVRTGYLEANARAEREPLEVPVAITIQNRTGRPLATSAEITGKDKHHARVELVKTEDGENGQELHLEVFGLKPTFPESDVFLTVTVKDGTTERATRSLPVRVSVPTLLRLQGEVLYEGVAKPGLVNRGLNMRSTPKAAVPFPEARMATMCLHDVELKVLDQYGDPLPAIFAGTPIFAALGESDYESTNRALREDGSFIDSIGFWQFVGGVDDMTVDPGRAEMQKFLALPPPPCTEKQYATYEPLLVQYQIGGYPIGSYRRQVTLKSSGDHHKPIMRIVFNPVEDPPSPSPPAK